MTNEDIETISNLEFLILNLNNEIDDIENQLNVNELDSTGSDDYFIWRKKAITSKTYKYKKLRTQSLKLKQFRRNIHERNLAKRGKVSNISTTMHQAMMKMQKAVKENKESEKTKRHKISNGKDKLTFNEFKRLIKLEIGEERCIELLEKARNIVESPIEVEYKYG